MCALVHPSAPPLGPLELPWFPDVFSAHDSHVIGLLQTQLGLGEGILDIGRGEAQAALPRSLDPRPWLGRRLKRFEVRWESSGEITFASRWPHCNRAVYACFEHGDRAKICSVPVSAYEDEELLVDARCAAPAAGRVNSGARWLLGSPCNLQALGVIHSVELQRWREGHSAPFVEQEDCYEEDGPEALLLQVSSPREAARLCWAWRHGFPQLPECCIRLAASYMGELLVVRVVREVSGVSCGVGGASAGWRVRGFLPVGL